MSGPEGMSERQMWLLLIIGSEPRIEGSTRLQKYGLLASKITLVGHDVYDDWTAYHFGAYSPALRSDLDALIQKGMARSTKTRTGDRTDYAITGQGRDAVRGFESEHADRAEEIKVITGHYSRRPLDEVLADAYSLFPEYTAKSTIRGRVRASIMRRNAGIGAEISLPYTDKMIGLASITTTAEVNRFPYGDEEFRRELAEYAGLADVPPTDPKAYDEMSEVLDDKEFLTKLSDDEIKEIIFSGR